MIVFLAGMQRSGSTFAFNVVRETLMARGQVHQEASSDIVGALSRAAGADHVILKGHQADRTCIDLVRQGACRTICTVRRIDDAVASWIETFGFTEDQSIVAMRDWIGLYRQVRVHALTIPYELIDHHPRRAAWRIGRYLTRDFGLREAHRIATRNGKAVVKNRMDALSRGDSGVEDVGFSFYDRNTFFHRRHVSSLVSRPAEHRLPAIQLARIRDALASDIATSGLAQEPVT